MTGNCIRQASWALDPHRSRIAVTPIPLAVQIEINPRPDPRCSSIFASAPTIRAPVDANGCPIAILPPFKFIFDRSIFPGGWFRSNLSRQNSGDSHALSVARVCAANAS